MNPEPVDEANRPASTLAPTTSDTNVVSHTLCKQLLGIYVAAVAVLLFYRLAGILIAAIGAMVFADAWTAGVFKKRDGSGFLNISPMGWGIATMGLFLVAYPLYAFNRNRLKTRPGNSALFAAVNVLGGLACLLAVLQMVIWVIHR